MPRKRITAFLISLITLIGVLVSLINGKDISSGFNPPLLKPSIKPVSELKIASSSAIFAVDGERAKVVKVVDGDTIELENGRKVRYIGIDTPETVDPRRPVGCFGKEAKEENKRLVEGREVVLQKDVSETDKYNRLLRYVFLPLDDGNALFVNDYLVREGYAHTLTYPPDIKFNEKFLEGESWARENKRGLWSKC